MSEGDGMREVKKGGVAWVDGSTGVHAVGVGAKIVGGKDTGELGIAVFVEKKKRREELAEGEVVPSEIDGVKTDVVETPRVRLLNADPNSITVPISPPAPGTTGGNVTLVGPAVPDDGLRVVVDLTVQQTGGQPIKQVAFAATHGQTTLPDLASALQTSASKIPGVTAEVSRRSPTETDSHA